MSLGVPFPLFILGLSRPIHIDTAVKNTTTYIYVIYKVLVYVKMSQPTTCFGLFQLGHIQFGHKGREELYNNAILSLKDRCYTLLPRPLPTNNTGTSSPLRSLPLMDKYVTTDYWQQRIYFNTTSLRTCPNFVNEISSPLTLMIILHYCIVPLTFMSKLKMV
jgi:hypothetical protein